LAGACFADVAWAVLLMVVFFFSVGRVT
jgi:hypothetical protein